MISVPKTDLSSVKKTDAYQWAWRVVTNKTEHRTCELIKLFAERFIKDLERDDIFFNLENYDKMNRYFSMFRHTKGVLVGKPFELRGDQKAFLGQIRAWQYRNTGEFRITETYKEVAKKNGKSWEAGGLAGMALTAFGESEAEVYSLATSEIQAGECWKAFKSMSKTTETYKKNLLYRVDEIRHSKSGSVFIALPSTGELLDGKNAFFIIVDEYHLFKPKDDLSFTSLQSGGVARGYMLVFKITTAGSNTHSSCFEERKMAVNVLKGTIQSDTYLPQIFTLDKGDDWQDILNWYKSNPALGISKPMRFMREQYEKALAMPRLLNQFKNKQLDIWTYGAADAWLNLEKWNALHKKYTPEYLKGKKCVIGMDLSDRHDLTSLVALFPEQEGISMPYVLPIFYVPAENAIVREAQDKVPYLGWAEGRYVNLVDDGYVNKALIKEKILELCNEYDVQCIGYDKWHASGIIEEIEAAGVPTKNVVQGIYLSPACRDLEEAISRGTLKHNGNPCMGWNIGNIVIDEDDKKNVKPNKKKSFERIDGVVALLVAWTAMNSLDESNIITECPIRFI